MTESGSGVGGPLGDSPSLTFFARATSADTAYNQQALNLVKDSLDANMITRDQKTKEKSGSEYRASENQPNLDFKLEIGRSASLSPLSDDAWKDLHAQFVQALPDQPPGEGIKSEYEAQMALPYDQRDSNYIALDNLLTFTSKALTVLSKGDIPVDSQHPSMQRMQGNLARPLVALQYVLAQSPQVNQTINERIEDLGPNFPYYDALTGMNQELSNAYEGLGQLADMMRQNPKGDITQQYASNLADQMNRTNALIQNTYTEGNLTFMKSQYAALTLLANAFAVRDTSIPNLYLGLKMATSSQGATPSNPGLPGAGLSTAVTNGVKGLVSLQFPRMDGSHQDLLSVLVMTGMSAFIGLGGQMVDPGYGMFPSSNPGYLAEAREFSFDAALHMMNGMGVVQGFYSSALDAAGVPEGEGENTLQVLTGATFLLMIQSGGSSLSEAAQGRLLASHASTINQALTFLEEALAHPDFQGAPDAAQAAGIAIQQARMALEQGDPESFYTAWDNLLQAGGTTGTQIDADRQEIDQSANHLIDASLRRSDDQVTEVISLA